MTEQPVLMRDIKLIVIDVDHTLLNNKSEVSERNAKAIKTAIAKGVKVMLATGKNYGSCKHIIQELGIDTPGIFTQGLTIHEPSGAVRHEKTLDPNIARRVITFAEDRGYAVVGYAQGRLLSRSSNPYIEELHTKWKEVKPEYIGPLQNVLGSIQFNKFIVMSAGDPRKAKAIRWQLNTQLNGNIRLMTAGIPHMLEVLPPNTSKGHALKSLLKELRIKPEQVIAIGDGENDIEMLEAVGISVAVANADPKLKQVANELTASNDDDGVAKIIEKYILDGIPAAPPPRTPETSIETTVPTVENPLEATAATTPQPEPQSTSSEESDTPESPPTPPAEPNAADDKQ